MQYSCSSLLGSTSHDPTNRLRRRSLTDYDEEKFLICKMYTEITKRCGMSYKTGKKKKLSQQKTKGHVQFNGNNHGFLHLNRHVGATMKMLAP